MNIKKTYIKFIDKSVCHSKPALQTGRRSKHKISQLLCSYRNDSLNYFDSVIRNLSSPTFFCEAITTIKLLLPVIQERINRTHNSELVKDGMVQSMFRLPQTQTDGSNSLIKVALIFLLFITTMNFAQSEKKIDGYVTDFQTGLPLVGANILIDGTGIGTSTDTEGYYQFSNLLAGNYSLLASYIGYNKKFIDDINITPGFLTQINITLKPETYKLKRIIVSSEDMRKTTSGSISVFNREEIEKKQSQTIGEILEELPGIEVQSTGIIGSSQKVSIRGSQSNQVLILLDGIPLNNQSSGDADLSTIPVNIIERIEVHEGGSSSRFGSGAIGGALNIITRNQFRNEVKLNSSIGSYGLKQIEPVISGTFKKLNYFLSYNYLESDGNFDYRYLDNAGIEQSAIRKNSAFESNNVFAKLNYQFTKSVLTLNWQNFNNNRGIPGKVYGLSPFANSENKNNIWGLNYFINSDKLSFTADLKYSSASTENRNLFPADTEPKFKKIPKYHYRYEVENFIINLTSIYNVSEWLNITAGYSLKKLDYKDKNFLPSIYSQTSAANDISHGIYLHQEWKKEFDWLNSKIVFTPAIRYDNLKLESKDLSRTESKWSPGTSLYFSIGGTNNLFVKANYSKSFRVPTFADLFYQDIRVEGKTDLLPECGTNKDLSIGGKLDLWGTFDAKFTIYENKINDLIVWRLGSFEVFRPFNTDAELSGNEYSVAYSFPNDIVSLSYSQSDLDPLNKNPDKTTYNKILPYKPLTSKKAAVSFKYKNITATIAYKQSGKRYVTEANTVEMPSNEVWNFNTSWLSNIDPVQIKWKLSVLNITNQKYEIIKNYPLPLREWRFGISITY
ncbi:MAG: TonB-dependent receptor [Melioribacteraceae bacterium]|nr:TonB-dependent receptor [Melioribacteraceae bacterium]